MVKSGKYYLLASVLIVILLISGISYSGSRIDEHKLSLSNLEPVHGTLDETFRAFVSGNQTIAYLQHSTLLSLDFQGNNPVAVEIKDFVLAPSGGVRYTEGEIIDKEVQLEGQRASFYVDWHPASALSSLSDDYLPGNTYRGLHIVCRWGDVTKEFVYVFRADAYRPEN